MKQGAMPHGHGTHGQGREAALNQATQNKPRVGGFAAQTFAGEKKSG